MKEDTQEILVVKDKNRPVSVKTVHYGIMIGKLPEVHI